MLHTSRYRVNDKNFKLSDIDPGDCGNGYTDSEVRQLLTENVKRIADLQNKLYAEASYSLLVIFQGMDAAGKDGAIKNVFSGLNPQSTHVYAFKQPSSEELRHDYLWRATKKLPESGCISVFNRSYYEDVLVVRVLKLVSEDEFPAVDNLWETRFRQIRDYEKHLYENRIIPNKFFLHISKKEQKERLLERIEDQYKNWKFNADDLKAREMWDKYQKFYQEAIAQTSTEYAPWYVIPANKKWFARLLISQVLLETLEELNPKYPKLAEEQLKMLERYKRDLMLDE